MTRTLSLKWAGLLAIIVGMAFPTVWGAVDSDGDGVTDADETAAGTDPANSQSVQWKSLGSWRFTSGTLVGDDGQQPIRQTNATIVASGFQGYGVQLLSNPNPVSLKYRAVEPSGQPNISATRGSILFRIRPNWVSGPGPGAWVTVLQTTNWAVRINPTGNKLMLTSTNAGINTTNVQISIAVYEPFGTQGNFNSSAAVAAWSYGLVTYSPEETSLSFDAPSTRVAGPGIVPPLDFNNTNYFLAIGSATDGTGPINGTIDEVVAFNAPGVLGLNTSQISAIASNSPAGLNLVWPSATNALTEVRRRIVSSNTWDTARAAFGTNFFDTNLVSGTRYEYNLNTRIASVQTGLPDAVGQFIKGTHRGSPLHNHGKIILLVDKSLTNAIETELSGFVTHLVGDGWQVLRLDVPRHVDDYSSSNSFRTNFYQMTNVIKPFIKSNYAVFGPEIKYVLAVGHVPVAYTGTIADDGHNSSSGRGAHGGAWASDLYYGDVDGNWTDNKTLVNSAYNFNFNYPNDGKLDQDFIPKNVADVALLEIPVARIDFANLPAFAESEANLLKRYFTKDSNFRKGIRTFSPEAMYAEYLGSGSTMPLQMAQEMLSKVAVLKNPLNGDVLADNRSFLFGVHSGPGFFDRINDSFPGYEHTTTDIALGNTSTNCAFFYLRGSYFPDWDSSNNFLRGILGMTNGGLATGAFLNSAKGWRADGLGVGLTIGNEMYDIANTWTVPGNIQSVRSVQLLGDPTLRYPVLAPPGTVISKTTNNSVTVSWAAAASASAGYYIYRSTNGVLGTFQQLTATPISNTNYTEVSVPAGSLVYMIRAAESVTTGGGTYTNLSQGVFSRPITSANPTVCCLGIQSLLEDSALAPTTFSIGEASTDSGLVLSVVTSNTNLAPAENIFLGGAGELRTVEVVLAPDKSGFATITVTAEATSSRVVKTLQLLVFPVNDPPTFTKGPDQTVAQGSGSHIIPSWASAISPGPPDESAQHVSFIVTNDNSHLFTSQPSVSAQGDLTFAVNSSHRGAALVSVTAQDDGGTASSGVNVSYPKLFNITVGLPLDTDGDGLPDDFEQVFGFDPNTGGDGALDWDGDGMTNLAEFAAGTDPKNARSSLRINSAGSLSPTFSIQFNSAPGKTYSVDANDSFPNTNTWFTIASPIPGSGSPIEQLDTSAGDSTRRIYRVVSSALGGGELVTEYAGLSRFTLLGNSDTWVSFPFLRPAAELAAVSSATTNAVQVRGIPAWTPNQWLYSSGSQSNTYFMLVRSGTLAGEYFTITENNTNSLTLNVETASLTGLQAGDSIAIIPYWTIGSIFHGGNAVHEAANQGTRRTEVLFPSISATGINLSASDTYYYLGGYFRKVGGGTVVRNDDVVLPDMYLMVRHNVSTNTVLTTEGAVLAGKFRTHIRRNTGSKQDNLLALARPVGISLNDSGLISSGAFRASLNQGNRTDELLIFDNTVVGKNKSASATYYYLDNIWRRVGGGTTNFGTEVIFQPGIGFIIRSGTDTASASWLHNATY